MEGDFRNTLIIISAIVIAGIFIHGFITIRRNKNPYKLKTLDERIDPVERGFDGSGFDQDGVSNVRVIGEQAPEEIKDSITNKPVVIRGSKPKESYISAVSTTLPIDDDSVIDEFDYSIGNVDDVTLTAGDMQIDMGLTDLGEADAASSAISHNKRNSNTSDANRSEFLDDMGDDIADFDYGPTSEIDTHVAEEDLTPKQPVKPLYETPITQEKPKSSTPEKSLVKPVTKVVDKLKKKSTSRNKQTSKRNQIELDFDKPISEEDMPSISAIDASPMSTKRKIERPTVDPEVIAVSVVMPDGYTISGAALLPALLTLGLRYGDMDIFHRHQDNAGNGKVTFSLANIMNPGTFNLDEIETFTTRGLTLFMTLPNAGDSFEVFQHMLNAAKQISLEFGAQILDDKRSVMTKQTEQHYTSKIREFERKKRIASA